RTIGINAEELYNDRHDPGEARNVRADPALDSVAARLSRGMQELRLSNDTGLRGGPAGAKR
ncbi:MAG: hypothetical protein ABIZ91_20145, partial [Gemmatimonadaceae bacterium]